MKSTYALKMHGQLFVNFKNQSVLVINTDFGINDFGINDSAVAFILSAPNRLRPRTAFLAED